jgi:hypothetical protein
MNKLKLWEQAWDERSKQAAGKHPLKMLKQLPEMPGITSETAKNLKWKSLKWMLTQDHERHIRKGFMRHPLKYGWSFLKSIFKKKSYERDKDFFFYGVNSEEEFKKLLVQKDTLLVLGFSYCHKPFECPAGRFTDACIHDQKNLVCQQCFIGKSVHASRKSNVIPLFIPTIHYIGGKIFEIVHQHPEKKVLFIITACEMTLEMFGDWGNMVDIKGIGVRLDGRICNTMKAFELSERGIKPGLTVVLDETQQRLLNLLYLRRQDTE